jgi:K+:H+ antiporter
VSRASRRGRHLAAYLTIIGGGLGVLALVLPLGHGLRAAPDLPEDLAVDGPATACLGPRLALAQTGVFLDVHAGEAGGEDGPRSARLARGRVDPETARVTVEGRCAARTARAGQRFTADLRVENAHDDVLAGTVTIVAAAGAERVSLAPVPTGEAGDGDRLMGSELVARVFLAVAAVVIASRLLGALCTRVRQPAVIGEIVAGIALGPSLLGAAWPAATDYLFPTEVTGALNVLAQLGLVFFMFLVGLDLDLAAVRGSGHTAVTVSHVSIAVPFALGAVLALGLYPVVATGDFTGFALFLGAAMAITAFPVLARILTDTGLDRTPLGALAVTCAAVDDVTAWCALSVVVAIARPGSASDPLVTVGLTLAFGAVMLGIVRPVLARLAERPYGHGAGPGGGRPGATWARPSAVLVAGVLLAAWTTEAIGIHAIFGAFLAGVVVPRRPDLVAGITARLEDLTRLLLLPTFFAVVGLSTSFGVLDRPELWAVTALVVAVAVAGKWGGSALAGRASGLDWRHASALGALMNTRGLTEIVILTVGRDLGIIGPGLFTAMVIMALVTTLMTTPLVTRLVPVPTLAHRNAGPDVRPEAPAGRAEVGANR